MHNHLQGCEALHSPRLPPEQPSSTELLKERTLNEVEELDLSFFSLNDIAAHHDSDQLGSKMPTVPIEEFKQNPDNQGQLQLLDRNISAFFPNDEGEWSWSLFKISFNMMVTAVLPSSVCLTAVGLCVAFFASSFDSFYLSQEGEKNPNSKLLFFYFTNLPSNSSPHSPPKPTDCQLLVSDSDPDSEWETMCEHTTNVAAIHIMALSTVTALMFVQVVVTKPADAPRKHLFLAWLLMTLKIDALFVLAIHLFGREVYFYFGIAGFCVIPLGVISPMTLKFVYRRWRKKKVGSPKKVRFAMETSPSPNPKSPPPPVIRVKKSTREKLRKIIHRSAGGLLVGCMFTCYAFYIIPTYRHGSNATKNLLRIGVHPICMILGDAFLRSIAIKKHPNSETPTNLRR